MSAPREPSSDPQDAALRERVRDALAAAEPAQSPDYARTLAAARARADGSRTAATARAPLARRLAYAAAALAVVAVLLATLVQRRAPVPLATTAHPESSALAAEHEADYRLALELSARFRARSPLDSVRSGLPDDVSRGLPELPDYRYPLLPKEIPL